MSESQRIDRALVALANAQTASDYRAAKKLAAKCDRLHQLALIDSVIEARERLTTTGVL
jgi:hypothetical protein